jgi:hypothetical protein
MLCFDGNSINTIIQFNRSYFRVHDPFQCCNNYLYQCQLTFSRPPTHSFFERCWQLTWVILGWNSFLISLTRYTPAFSRVILFPIIGETIRVFLNKLLKRRWIKIRMLHQIGSHLKCTLACLRSCFIFTSFGTFCACCWGSSTSSFKLTQPSNIEVGTYVYFT